MTEKLEAKPFLSKGGKIHKSFISNTDRSILNEIEYTEKTEVPRELIKFYSVSENSVNALTNGYLWSANPSDFNDPFDCPIQLWDFTSFAFENLVKLINPNFHFMINKNELHNRNIFFQVRLRTLGIVCLHESSLKDQDILWGYYSNLKGFAIKFNSHQLIKKWSVPFKVEYLKKSKLDRFDLNDLETSADIFPMLLRWSTQKKKTWKNENEWRFIFSSLKFETLNGDTFEEERKKKYHFSSIEEIILGLKFFHKTNMVEVSGNNSYYIIEGEQHKLQNEILSFLSFPSEIPVKHMFMKVDELAMTPRLCKIFKEKEGRFYIYYPLASEEEYQIALKRLEVIFNAPIGTSESDEADELARLVDEYEQTYYPIDRKD